MNAILERLRRFRRWLAYRIYPEGRGEWDRDMSLEIDRQMLIIEDLGGKP